MNRKLVAAIAIALCSTNVQAEMTTAEKKAYIIASDPAPAGTEYVIQKATDIVIIIPPDQAESVNDQGTERELVAAFVRMNLIYTGHFCKLLCGPTHRWFEWQDVTTKKKYRMFENDTVTALFVDGSTVKFRFIGTAYHCPSGQCFEWKVGTETKPLFKPKKDRKHPGRKGAKDGNGKEKGDHYVHTGNGFGGGGFSLYDPYDPDNWAGPAPGTSSVPVAPAPVAPPVKAPPVVVAPPVVAPPVTATPRVRDGGGSRR
jgi:hypothetical protein